MTKNINNKSDIDKNNLVKASSLKALDEIDKIKQRIEADLNKIKQLEQQRSNDISQLINKVNLNYVDNETLVGALLYIKEQLSQNTSQDVKSMRATWLETGRKFLKRRSRSTSKKK